MMGARPWLILTAVALARLGFGYQYQTVATLGPDLMRVFRLDYAMLGALIGAFMLLGGFLAMPLGLLARRYGDRLVLGTGLAVMVLGPVISAAATGAAGIGLGRGAAGVGAVAMIVSSTSSFGRASQDVDGRPAPAMTMGQGRGFIQGGSAHGRCELAMTRAADQMEDHPAFTRGALQQRA